MKRRAPTIWAAVVVLGVGGLAYRDAQLAEARSRKASAEADKKANTAPEKPKSDGDTDDTNVEDLPAREETAPSPSSARFHMMPDGSPVPALPPSTPERIKLGVAIFRYQGSQGSSDSTRSRESALALAQEASKLAREDFAAAVKKGDRGSSENIGWIKQRVLERAVEFAVFSLEKGEISEAPIDTPRGFWVAKRLR